MGLFYWFWLLVPLALIVAGGWNADCVGYVGQLAQIVTTGCYGRLVGGVLEWYFWGDAALWVFCFFSGRDARD